MEIPLQYYIPHFNFDMLRDGLYIEHDVSPSEVNTQMGIEMLDVDRGLK